MVNHHSFFFLCTVVMKWSIMCTIFVFKAVHVEGQLEAESFRCLWVGCKVYDKASCSVSWLERHVLTHGGHKPFKCIVDGCGQRFTSQVRIILRVLSILVRRSWSTLFTLVDSCQQCCHKFSNIISVQQFLPTHYDIIYCKIYSHIIA